MPLVSRRDPLTRIHESKDILVGRPLFAKDTSCPLHRKRIENAKFQHWMKQQENGRGLKLPKVPNSTRDAIEYMQKEHDVASKSAMSSPRIALLPGVALSTVGVMGYTGHKPGYSDGSFGVGASFAHSIKSVARYREVRGDRQQMHGILPEIITPRRCC